MRNELTVLYEDDDILAVSKPAGVSSIPERYETGRLNALSAVGRGGVSAVHRIDKDTSGVLLFCLTRDAFQKLSEEFSRREVRKFYHALVPGSPPWEETDCGLGLRPDGDRRHRTVPDPAGKESRTLFRVIEHFRNCSLVEARPLTGRTHQIRAHLSALGFPVLCDPLYGSGGAFFLSSFKRGYRASEGEERPLLSRPALHAFAVELAHPRDSRPLRIEAPYTKDFAAALKQLRKYGR